MAGHLARVAHHDAEGGKEQRVGCPHFEGVESSWGRSGSGRAVDVVSRTMILRRRQGAEEALPHTRLTTPPLRCRRHSALHAADHATPPCAAALKQPSMRLTMPPLHALLPSRSPVWGMQQRKPNMVHCTVDLSSIEPGFQATSKTVKLSDYDPAFVVVYKVWGVKGCVPGKAAGRWSRCWV
eukprot:365729-Chlamydomonas_euryale.AAC.7